VDASVDLLGLRVGGNDHVPLVFGWIHFTSAPDDQMTCIRGYSGFR
jgi:hypothetical protein